MMGMSNPVFEDARIGRLGDNPAFDSTEIERPGEHPSFEITRIRDSGLESASGSSLLAIEGFDLAGAVSSGSGASSQGLAKNRGCQGIGKGRHQRLSMSGAGFNGAPIANAAAAVRSRPPNDSLPASMATTGADSHPSVRPVSTRPGPTSIQRSMPTVATLTASRNLTGAVTWRRRRSRTSRSDVTSTPVTLDTNLRWGWPIVSPANARPNGSTAPATIGEWNAWETASRVAAMPHSRALRTTSSIADVDPDKTVCRGAFRPAMTTGSPLTSETTSSRLAWKLAMAPSLSPSSAITLPAHGRRAEQGPRIERTGPVQGSQLSQAVTDGDIGHDAQVAKQPDRRHRRDDDGRLRHGGRPRIASRR